MANIYAYAIKNQWINMSLYFVNFMYNTKKPFRDTAVGKVLKSRAFKYFAYYYYLTQVGFVAPWLFIAIGANMIRGDITGDYTIEYNSIFGPDDSYQNSKQVCRYLTTPDRLKDNNDELGGGQKNTKFLANGDFIHTNFIKLDKTDLVKFFENSDNGFSFRRNQLNNPSYYMRHDNFTTPSISQPVAGYQYNYTYTNNITNQERDQNNTSINNDNDEFYFLKATNNNDIVIFTVLSSAI